LVKQLEMIKVLSECQSGEDSWELLIPIGFVVSSAERQWVGKPTYPWV